MNKGWIKLYRGLRNVPVLQDPGREFSRYEAFEDLLLSASHKETEIRLNGELVKIPAGSFITSKRKLSQKWHWSKGKVDRFLEELQGGPLTDPMIGLKTAQRWTHITIMKWEGYQGSQPNDRPKNGPINGPITGPNQEESKKIQEGKDAGVSRARARPPLFPGCSFVRITEEEFASLVLTHGSEEEVREAIEDLDLYFQGKPYKDHPGSNHFGALTSVKAWGWDLHLNQKRMRFESNGGQPRANLPITQNKNSPPRTCSEAFEHNTKFMKEFFGEEDGKESLSGMFEDALSYAEGNDPFGTFDRSVVNSSIRRIK